MAKTHYLTTDEWEYLLTPDDDIILLEYLKECPAKLEMPDEIDGHLVTVLGAQLFREQKSLRQVKFPKGLECIGDEAFYKCSNLTICSTDLPETLIQIGDRAFQDCGLVGDTPSETDGNTVFTFPPSCEHIGEGAFFGTRINTFPGRKRIDEDASFGAYVSTFGGITLVLPSTIKTLDEKAFANSNFVCVRCERNVSNFCFDSCDKLEKAIVAGSVDDHAFYFCEKLKDVELREGVANIGKYSFSGTTIKSIAFPKSLNAIREGAFWSCKALESVSFENTALISEKVFYGNPIKKVELPPKMQVAIDNGGKLDKEQVTFIKALMKNEIELKSYSLLMALAATL